MPRDSRYNLQPDLFRPPVLVVLAHHYRLHCPRRHCHRVALEGLECRYVNWGQVNQLDPCFLANRRDLK